MRASNYSSNQLMLVMNTAWEKSVVSHWPYVAGITAIWLIARQILQHISKIPAVGDSKDSNFITAIEQGCKKVIATSQIWFSYSDW